MLFNVIHDSFEHEEQIDILYPHALSGIYGFRLGYPVHEPLASSTRVMTPSNVLKQSSCRVHK
eukprot:28325-Eustigmatos_ZCMA.PRE.1